MCRYLIFALGALVNGVIAVRATAEFKICNETSKRVWSAIAYHDAGDWLSRGWYSLAPGECKSPINTDLTRRKYYVYAHTEDGRRWKDFYSFCVSKNAFRIRGDNSCEARGYEERGFIPVSVGESLSFTARLRCQNDSCDIRPGWIIDVPFSRSVGGVTIDGQAFSAPTTGRVKVDFTGNTLYAKVKLRTNLADFQRGLPRIIQAHVNHNDDCNEIINVHTIRLSPSGRSLRVYAAGHYEDWECPWFETPFGDVELGKHRIFEQDGDVTAYLTPQTNGDGVWISVNVANINANGLLGNLLGTSWFGPWIRDMITASIPQTIHLGNIQQHLPEQLRGFPIRLTDVGFYDAGGGQLGLETEATVTVSAAYADSVWKRLLQ